MAVNKNFVVKNGLEVGGDTLFANSVIDRVGVGTTNPTSTFSVNGNTSLQDLSVSGVSTFTNSVAIGNTIPTSALTVVGSGTSTSQLYVTGVSTFRNNAYITDQNRLYFGDESLSISYQVVGITSANYIETFDHIPLNIITENLTVGASDGEIYANFKINSSVSLFYDNAKKFETSGLGVTVTGVTSTTYLYATGISTFIDGPVFIGSGTSTGTELQRLQVTGGGYFSSPVGIGITNPSNTLTVVGSGTSTSQLYVTGFSTFVGYSTFQDYVNIEDGLYVAGVSTFVGYSTFQDYVNIEDGLYVAGISTFVGYSTFRDYVNIEDGLNVSGISTFVGYSTFRDYVNIEDGLNVSGISTFVGFSTFNDYVNIEDGLNVAGISTLVGNVSFGSSAFFGDNGKLNLGNSNDLQIYHNGTDSYIHEVGSGSLIIRADGTGVELQKITGENLGRFLADSSVELYFNNSKKFHTTGVGVSITGITITDQLSVSGVSTFSDNINADDIFISAGNALYVNTDSLNSHIFGGLNQDLLLFKSRGSGPISDLSIDVKNASLNMMGGSDLSVFKVYGDGSLRSYYHTISGSVPIQSERFSITGGDSTGLEPSEILMKVGTGITVSGNSGIISATSFIASSLVDTTSLNSKLLNVGTGGTVITTTLNGLVGVGSTDPTSKLTVDGDGNFTGVITATKFVGDGSGLTGVVGSGSGVVILDEGSTVGTAGTIDFGPGLAVSPIVSGITTVNVSSWAITQWQSTAAGINTSSNVGIGTTNPISALTVKGDTSLETLNVSGVSTFAGITTVTGSTLFAKQGNFAGIITATMFVGDGSGLTGVVGSGSGIVVLDDGSAVGTAGTIDFGTGLSISQMSAGIVTVTASGGFSSQWETTAAGIHTLSSVGIGTTNPTSKLTVQSTGSASAGEEAFHPFIIKEGTFERSLWMGYATNIGGIGEEGAYINAASTGFSRPIYLSSRNQSQTPFVGIGTDRPTGTSGQMLQVDGGAYVSGNLGIGSKSPTSKLTVQGDVRVSGVITAGSINGTQLNISGVTTISSGRIQADASANLRFGNSPAGSGSGRNIAIGDQVLSSLSGGSGRNIGIGELSYFDTTTGQYNIGIGERSGQKVTTGAYNVILGSYDGNSGNLDIRTSSNNVVIADGQGNIRQYINSSGNVGIKTTVITEALTVAGIVSATGFYGTLNAGQLTGSLPAIDGSALIGVVATGIGVEVQDDATPVGTAGTINFGSNLSVSFADGTATVSGASSVSAATTAYALAGTPNLNVGVVTASKLNISGDYIVLPKGTGKGIIFGEPPYDSPNQESIIFKSDSDGVEEELVINNSGNGVRIVADEIYLFTSSTKWSSISSETSYFGGYNNSSLVGIGSTQPTSKLDVSGNARVSGVITASSFSGSASGLTNIPSAQLTGALPAIDGSALLNVTAAGTGVGIHDDQVNVGSATTIDFGTGLDVTFSAGIATITSSGGSLQSRTTVTGVTTSIANNGIGNTDITGFKSYALLKVGLSTAGWLRLYTDSTSRANDVSRSVGEDPAPGSGVIAEVVTTGISTTQIISPFVMGGNLDEPADTTIYASITNLSGSTQAITANLTILQLEA